MSRRRRGPCPLSVGAYVRMQKSGRRSRQIGWYRRSKAFVPFLRGKSLFCCRIIKICPCGRPKPQRQKHASCFGMPQRGYCRTGVRHGYEKHFYIAEEQSPAFHFCKKGAKRWFLPKQTAGIKWVRGAGVTQASRKDGKTWETDVLGFMGANIFPNPL